MEYRSPLGNVFNFLSGLPQGHDKPVKHALYNCVALLVLGVCCAAGYALFLILEPFIKPLMWALLVGSVLHPFKCSLANRFRAWFDSLEEAGRPVFIGLIFIPVDIINAFAEFVGSKLMKHIKIIIAVVVAIPLLHIVYNYTPRLCVYLIWQLALYSNAVIDFVINNATITLITLLLIGYFSLMFIFWSPETNRNFHFGAIGVWLLLSCCLAHQFGSFRLIVFIALQVVFVVGFVYEIYEIHDELNSSGNNLTLMETLSWAFHAKTFELELKNENAAESIKNTSKESDKATTDVKPAEKLQPLRSMSKNETKSLDSHIYPTLTDKSGVKCTAEGISKTSENVSKVSRTTKQQDPWSLELFATPEIEHSKSDVTISTKSTPVMQSSDTSKNDNTKTTVSEVLSSPADRSNQKYKFQRSYSQPFFRTNPHLADKFRYLTLTRTSGFNRQSSLNSQHAHPEQYASDFYIYTLFWACIAMLFWKNFVLMPMLPLPILIYTIKHLGTYLGVWNWLYRHWNNIVGGAADWCDQRYDALIPVPIRGLLKVMHKINIALQKGIKESIDTVASCVVIMGLLIFVLCASIFVVFQVYTEAIMLVQMTSNVINQTVVHNPELRQLLPPSFDDTVGSILDNAYQYGREGISKAVRGIMSDVDSAKSAKLENQVLELWDRVYQSWMSSDSSSGPKVTSDAVQSSWYDFVDHIQKSPEMFNFSGIVEFVQQNIGMFMSLLESVWSILKGNISLVLGSFSAFISVLLGGGTAVLNFILNVIVFLTTLFYLLSSSGDLYKPVELMTNFSPSGSRLGLALEGAISGVFTASFKMAAFYGMWTWFIHNLFNVKIIYLPSAFAAILGAVPFLGTYLAGIPAVLDLWLAQDKGFQAILFAIFQFLPTSVVDTTIYNEIQGSGHPYLTGLAIAGGIFCLGVEGAIIGPLLLCGLYVFIDLSSSLFKESPSEEDIHLPDLSRLELQNS